MQESASELAPSDRVELFCVQNVEFFLKFEAKALGPVKDESRILVDLAAGSEEAEVGSLEASETIQTHGLQVCDNVSVDDVADFSW